MEKQSRRGLLKNAASAVAAAAGAAVLAPEAKAQAPVAAHVEWKKKAIPTPTPPPNPTSAPAAKLPPLFSGIVTFGNLVFLSGVGAHFPGTVEEHTKHVLDELERNLIAAGSSMEKVLNELGLCRPVRGRSSSPYDGRSRRYSGRGLTGRDRMYRVDLKL
jgi:2-iminobutanoate/2-iminopropanoate deaminase